MNRRQILAALLPLSSSGCLRLSTDQDDEGGERTRTLTTTSTPTETTTTTTTETETTTETDEELEYPVGLSEDGVSDFLTDTHVNALAFTPFTEVWQSKNVTLSHTKMDRISHIDDGAALIKWRDGSGITKYSTRNGQYWRQPLGNRAMYGKDRGTFDFNRHSRAEKLRKFIKAGDWNPPTVDESTNTFEITADGYEGIGGLDQSWWRVEEMQSFSAEGTVDERGVVTRLLAEFEYVPEDEDRVFKARVRHRVKNVGEVAVTEPDWYESAKERAPDISARITDDRQFVELQHRSGDPIPQGTVLDLTDRDTYDDWEWGHNDEPIEAGTTLYLWIEDGQFRWTRGSRPENADPRTLDGRYVVKLLRNGVHYLRKRLG